MNKKAPFFHLVARTHGGAPVFLQEGLARRIWRSLRELAPLDTLACVLMPDHIHWIVRSSHPELLVQRLMTTLALHSARAGFKPGIWERAPKIDPIPNGKHLMRSIRYVLLNPSRDGLVKHPAEWRWSTMLDLLGAVREPWTTFDAIEREIGWLLDPNGRNFEERLLRYVFEDPTVEEGHLPTLLDLPTFDDLPEFPANTLDDIARAVSISLRTPVSELRARPKLRQRLAHVAISLGWDVPRKLAPFMDWSPRSARRARSQWRHERVRKDHLRDLHPARVALANPDWGSLPLARPKVLAGKRSKRK